MVEMFRSPDKPKDQEEGDLSSKKLSNPRQESDRDLDKGETYDWVSKKRLFDLVEIRCAKSKATILTNVRRKISELGKIRPWDLGKGLEIQKECGDGY